MEKTESKKILVAGAGISGIGAAHMLIETGESVVLYDSNESLDRKKLEEEVPGARILLGELTAHEAEQIGYCVISPGIPLRAPFVQVLKEAGVPILGEIEAAYRHGKGRLAAITGTNGKTTTTALVGEILRAYFPSTFVVGNIGTSYTAHALEMREDSVTAAEVSSFQLETIVDFHPQVSAILNITPDHLDRHGSMEEYIRVKELIAKNQGAEDTCVLNYEDEELRRFGGTIPARVVYFSSRRPVKGGVYVEGDSIVSELSGEKELLVKTEELKILGRHNHENACAAAAVAWAMGVPLDVIRNVMKEFRAVEHRIEFVTEKDGVAYYNDSKGTNPDAAIQGIRAMVRPTVLIAGGYDKGSQYGEWLSACVGKVTKLILLGQTAQKIAAEAEGLGLTDYCFASSMEEAVQLAREAARPGDAVLLSPACASWGMFKNYEERGRIFKELVK